VIGRVNQQRRARNQGTEFEQVRFQDQFYISGPDTLYVRFILGEATGVRSGNLRVQALLCYPLITKTTVRKPNREEEDMPDLKKYRLFISHSWTYSDKYEKLVYFFNEHPYFSWENYSVPMDDPIHNSNNDTQLYNAIKEKIYPVNCVVMLAGVYSTYSKWINKEIQISKKDYSKPIIAVEPWASKRTSKVVKDNADEIVKWQSASIVNAIRRHSI